MSISTSSTGIGFLALVGLSFASTAFAQTAPAPAAPTDTDGDGYMSDVDCDDADNDVNPGVAPIIGDGENKSCAPETEVLGDLLSGIGVSDMVWADGDEAEITAALAAAYKRSGPAGRVMLARGIAGCLNDTDFPSSQWRMPATEEGGPYSCYAADGSELPDGYKFTWINSGVDSPADQGQDRRISGAYVRASAAQTVANEAKTEVAAAMAKANEVGQDLSKLALVVSGEDGGLVARVNDLEKVVVYGIDTDGDGKVDIAGVAGQVRGLSRAVYGLDIDGDGRTDGPRDMKGVIQKVADLEAKTSGYDLALYGADGEKNGIGGFDGDVENLKKSGFSLGVSGGVGYNALQAYVVEACTSASSDGCLETDARTIRDGGYSMGVAGLYIASNIPPLGPFDNFSRVQLDVVGMGSMQGGQGVDGEDVEFSARNFGATLSGVTGVGGENIYAGAYVGGGAGNLGWTPIAARANDVFATGGFAARFEPKVKGPFEGAADLKLGAWLQRDFTVVSDASGDWIAPPWTTMGAVLSLTVSGGVGPVGR